MQSLKPLCRQLALAALVALAGTGNTMAVEEAEYTVVREDKPFELRHYAPHILAETVVEGDFEGAGSKAFRRLFNYISGSNTSRESLDMTSPVGQQSGGEKIDMTSPVGQQRVEDRWVVSFMMPAAYSMETLPKPEDPAVNLRQVPARFMAAVRYSGFWSEERYQQHREKLAAWIAGQSLTVVGEPVWARYDPPFMPWFMRRNEILVPVLDPSNSQ
jgi:hypothetical protein